MADPHPGLAEIEGRPKALPEHVSDSRGWFRLSAIYCFLVFLLSWGIFLYAWATRNADWHFDLGSAFHFNLSSRWVVAGIGGYAPAVVAILLGLVTRFRYFPNPLSQVRSPIRSKGLYTFAIVAPVAVILLSYLIQQNFSDDVFSSFGFFTIGNFALTLLLNLVIAPLGEEPGWRGCLLPLLSRRLGLWAASLVVGVIWAAWHLPIYLLIFEMPVDSYLVSCISIFGMSVALAALYLV